MITMKKNFLLKLTLTALIFCCLFTEPASGQLSQNPGHPDGSFGRNGVVLGEVPVSPPGETHDYLSDMVVQPDGKVLTGGYRSTSYQIISTLEIRLTRYEASGAPDVSFGKNGTVITSLGQHTMFESMTLLANGKILVAGYIGSDMLLVRYNHDGGLDHTFGIGGVVTMNLSGFEESATSWASKAIELEDGKIAVIGGTWAVSNPMPNDEVRKSRMLFARFNADGSPDNSFGSFGRVITPLPYTQTTIQSVFRTSDGSFLVPALARTLLNQSTPPGPIYEYASIIIKYRGDGSLDPNYGKDGILIDEPFIYTILKELGNGYVLAGRYNTLVTLDPQGRKVNEIISNRVIDFDGQAFWPRKFALQSDGKIISLGVLPLNLDQHTLGLVRFTPDGEVDPTFGNNGLSPSLSTSFTAYENLRLNLQEDGKVLVGSSTRAFPKRPVISRFNGDLIPPKNVKPLTKLNTAR